MKKELIAHYITLSLIPAASEDLKDDLRSKIRGHKFISATISRYAQLYGSHLTSIFMQKFNVLLVSHVICFLKGF